jgi:hypothetical protein
MRSRVLEFNPFQIPDITSPEQIGTGPLKGFASAKNDNLNQVLLLGQSLLKKFPCPPWIGKRLLATEVMTAYYYFSRVVRDFFSKVERFVSSILDVVWGQSLTSKEIDEAIEDFEICDEGLRNERRNLTRPSDFNNFWPEIRLIWSRNSLILRELDDNQGEQVARVLMWSRRKWTLVRAMEYLAEERYRSVFSESEVENLVALAAARFFREELMRRINLRQRRRADEKRDGTN